MLESKMVEAKSKKDTLKARAKTAQTSRQIADMVQVISSFTPGLAMHSSAWLCRCSQGNCIHCIFLTRTPLLGSAAAHKKVADPLGCALLPWRHAHTWGWQDVATSWEICMVCTCIHGV
jgi:hypothetical protein